MRYRFPNVALISVKLVLSQTPAHTARPRIRASVSRDVPVYYPSFRWVLVPAYPQRAISGWVDLGAWLCADSPRQFTGHPSRLH